MQGVAAAAVAATAGVVVGGVASVQVETEPGWEEVVEVEAVTLEACWEAEAACEVHSLAVLAPEVVLQA